MPLEWAASCPPPLRDFDRMTRIRSERRRLHFPEYALGSSRGNLPQNVVDPLAEDAGGAGHEGH
jgi:cytochrome c oxidase subunit I